MLLPFDSCSVASGKIVGVLSTFSSGQALNLKFTATVCSAQQKDKWLSHQGDSDFLNTNFLQVTLEALKGKKPKDSKQRNMGIFIVFRTRYLPPV